MRTSILFMIGMMALALTFVAYPRGQQDRPTMTQQELVRRLQAPITMLLLDVRSPEEFAQGHIPGAINVPYTVLSERLDEVRSYQAHEVIVYCERGVRAEVAEEALRTGGFTKVLHLEGDMGKWRKNALPVVMSSGKF